MYYCSLAVHLPHSPSKMLNGKKIAGTTPSAHMDMIKELDVQMEMLIETLKKKGVYDNTIIVFTSDNGGLLGKETMVSGHRSSDIYRGGKNQPYEGGHRVPFIASWPGHIKAKSVTDTPIVSLDILGTLADLTNQKIDENQAIDSASLLPMILGKNKADLHPFIISQSGTTKEAVIIKDGWKLVISFDKKDKSDSIRTPYALYNLKDNIEEKEGQNLINEANYKAKIDELFTAYNNVRDSGTKTKI